MRDSSLRSTGPNLAKSTLGQGSRSMPPTPPPAARRGRLVALARRRAAALREGLDVLAHDAAVRRRCP